MTDWQLAGEKADARLISNLLRAKFNSPEKEASRQFVADYFRAFGARTVAEFWGGGAGTDVLRRTLPDARIISVENGSVCGADWFHDSRGNQISPHRLSRAHRIAADQGRYEAVWGDIENVGIKADAVWLDLCSQWSRTTASLMDSVRSAELVAVTLMPERDELGKIGRIDRIVALASLVLLHTGLTMVYAGFYQRNNGGQEMALFLLRHGSRGWSGVHPHALAASIVRYGYWCTSELESAGLLLRPTRGGSKRRGTPAEYYCTECKNRIIVAAKPGGSGRGARRQCSADCRLPPSRQTASTSA